MEVQAVSSTVVHAPGLPVAASAVPLNVFDKFAPDMHVAVLYAFVSPTASNEVIRHALVKTLFHFPKLTGRMGHDDLRRPCIHIGGREGGGALLVEATVASDLADHLPIEPSPALLRLHPPTEGADHLLQVQLNRFRCGGLVVGATAHHHVADGQAMGNFFAAWGKSVRGLAIDPLPVHDCRRWLQPRSPPRCEFQHWGVDFVPEDPAAGGDGLPAPTEADDDSIDNISLHYTSKFIETALRARMRERYTIFESLLGHLWRKMTMARGLDGERFTQINISVDGRRRLKPPVPAEFFGNLVLTARPRARAKELLAGGVEGAAKLIHEAVLRVGDDYFRSVADFESMNEGKDLKPVDDDGGNVMHPDVEVDSWLGLRFDDVDFGGGGLSAFAPTWVPAEGLVLFLPSRHHGGVNVVVTLFKEHAKLFRTMSHSLE